MASATASTCRGSGRRPGSAPSARLALLLVLAVAGARCMPVESPPEDEMHPDILVLMPSSQTDGPADAAANQLDGAQPSSPSPREASAAPRARSAEDASVSPSGSTITDAQPVTAVVHEAVTSAPVTPRVGGVAAATPAPQAEEVPTVITKPQDAESDTVETSPKTEEVSSVASASEAGEAATAKPIPEQDPAREATPATTILEAGEVAAETTTPEAGEVAAVTTIPEAGEVTVVVNGTKNEEVTAVNTVAQAEEVATVTTVPQAEQVATVTAIPQTGEMVARDSSMANSQGASDEGSRVGASTGADASSTSIEAVASPRPEPDSGNKEESATESTPPLADLKDVTNVEVDTVTNTIPVEAVSVEAMSSSIAFSTEVVDATDVFTTESNFVEGSEPDAPAEMHGSTASRGRAFDKVSVPVSVAASEAAPAQTTASASSRLPEATPAPRTEEPATRVQPETANKGVDEDARPTATEVAELLMTTTTEPESDSSPASSPSESPLERADGQASSSTPMVIASVTIEPPLSNVQPSAELAAAAMDKDSAPAATIPAQPQDTPQSSEAPAETASKDTPVSETPTTTTRTADEALPSLEAAAASADKIPAANPDPVTSTSTTAPTTEATTAVRGVTRGGAAKPINEAATAGDTVEAASEAEARAVVAESTARPTAASSGRSLGGDGVVSSPDCPKDVMEADARFIVILVLLGALSVLGVSVIVLVMKFRVKPAARRSITMSMCWCLRWGRARRATITPPFANHVHLQHAGSTGRASEVERGKGEDYQDCKDCRDCKEDYNLASDEDCRAGEAGEGQAQDMPTWTFCEKAAMAATPGPQSPQAQKPQVQREEEEVLCSRM